MDQMKSHHMTVLNQMQQVFVYDEPTDTVNSAENGTLNLLKTLPEGQILYSRDLHCIRREFVQRVFTFYIRTDKIEEEQMGGGQQENRQDDTGIHLE